MNLTSGQTVGPFTEGTARLVRRGGLDLKQGGGSTFEDVYTLVLREGRPSASQSGAPALGSAHPDVAGYVASEIKWEQRATESQVWDATVTYTQGTVTAATESQPARTDFNKRWSTRTVTADFTQDAISGDAVANAAGEPFESVPQREIVCPVVSFSRITSAAPSSVMGYNGTVNSAAITVMGIAFGVHCARLTVEAQRLDSGDYQYDFTIAGATNMYAQNTSDTPADIGWDQSFLNCGYSVKVPDSSAEGFHLAAILVPDANGRMVRPNAPQLLSLDGENVMRIPYFLKFSPYPESSWAALNLPSS